MYKNFLFLTMVFAPIFGQNKAEEYLFKEEFKPTITTIFENKGEEKKIIRKQKDPIIKPTQLRRSILLMITDKAVGFVKFIWPYLYPMGWALAIIVIIKLNNGSLTGTEVKNILYYFPPKKN